jgi:tRNA pseudouridine13 synthase
LRIKTVPEDFLVEERLSVQPKARGPYALYRVEKRNITTLEAAQILSHALKVKPSAIAFPALKDKVAVAIQHCTVKISASPIPKEIQTTAIAAKLLGYLDRPLSPKDLAENKFTVTVREISREEVEAYTRAFFAPWASRFPQLFRFAALWLVE